MMALIPLLLIIVTGVIWGGVAIHKNDSGYLTTHGIATLIILLFLIHPTLIKVMFSVFSCREIEHGEAYLIENLEIHCWQLEHATYAICVGLSSIITWGIGCPAACLIALVKYRKQLKEIPIRVRFGFLFNGYSDSQYYWEFVILYRKIFIICCSVFLKAISIPVQALCVLILLIISLHIQNQIQPFMSSDLNQMEFRSILVATVTIYSGLYFLTQDLDQSTKLILFITMIVANLYFFIYWCSKMFQAGIDIAKQKLPCFYVTKVEEKDSDFISRKAPQDTTTFTFYEPQKVKAVVEAPLKFASMKDFYLHQLDKPLLSRNIFFSKRLPKMHEVEDMMSPGARGASSKRNLR